MESQSSVGTVTGTRDTNIFIMNVCGIRKDEAVGSYNTKRRIPLRVGNELYDHDTLKMSGDDFIQIERYVNSEPFIITIKADNFILPDCKCNYVNNMTNTDKMLNVVFGKFVFNHNKLVCPMESQHSITINMGTIYAREISENSETIKVYEGSVEIRPTKYNTGPAEELTKIVTDYKDGKITMEEYMVKMKEVQGRYMEEQKKFSDKIVVEAGYMITVGDKLGDIVPIPADDDKWWEK